MIVHDYPDPKFIEYASNLSILRPMFTMVDKFY